MTLLLAWFQLGVQLVLALGAAGPRALPKRLLLFALLWLLLGLLTLLHLVGFALDECLFRGYRKVVVKRPVFILGMPRSGTTFWQRLLARDPQFTSLTLWECLLAPSVTERYLWSALGQGLKPLARLPGIGRWHAMDRVHSLGWREPEEDFLLLLYKGGCFLPALLCPQAERYWRLGFFDCRVSGKTQASMLRFYYRCVQRHLYFHGPQRRFLSKNPSFTPMLRALQRRFPDARFLACHRHPSVVVPSQLSALKPALAVFARGRLDTDLRERMLSLLHHYYRCLEQVKEWDSVILLPLEQLPRLLAEQLPALYAFVQAPLTEPVLTDLKAQGQAQSARPSQHRYRLTDFGLTRTRLEREFADVWPGLTTPEMRAVAA